MTLPEYTHDPAYMELAHLCELCGIRIEYVDLSSDAFYARCDRCSVIQMGTDTDYKNSEHAAIVLGHELSHLLEDSNGIRLSDLHEYEVVPYPGYNGLDNEKATEDLCDCWGVALYSLALQIAIKKAESIYQE